jgi:hypothetical protein
MKIWMKIILPIVGIAYIIAFMEIDLPGLHQTWNDPYDAYIISQQKTTHAAKNPFDLKVAGPLIAGIPSIGRIVLTLFFISVIARVFLVSNNPCRIYLKNCTFLI